MMALFLGSPGAATTALNAFSLSKKPPLLYMNPTLSAPNIIYNYSGVIYGEEQLLDNFQTIKNKSEELKREGIFIFCVRNGELYPWIMENINVLKFKKAQPLIHVFDEDLMIHRGVCIRNVSEIIGYLAAFL